MYRDSCFDIHSHILYGVDDGARSMGESLEMLGMARAEGIRALILTPHYGAENGYAPAMGLVLANFRALKAEAAALYPDLRLFLGSELYCAPGQVTRRVEQGLALPMAGTRALLLEFLEYGGVGESAEHIARSLAAVAEAGWVPILAHAERYRAFEGRQELYRALAAGGVFLQVNAYDLYDHPEGWVKDNARWIVENRLARFIGTDAHRPDHRPPRMRSGVEYLYDHYDEDYVDALVFGNAERMFGSGQTGLQTS